MIHLITVWRKGKCTIISSDTIQKNDLLEKPITMDDLTATTNSYIGITTEKLQKAILWY